MRKSTSYAIVFLILLLILVVWFRPRVARWFPAAPPSSAPIAAPDGGVIEGPYFSDGGRVAERIVAAINRTGNTLDVAMYDLTEPDIAAALEAAARRGVRVRIVADEQQSREPYSEIPELESHGAAVRLSRGYRGNRSIMHDKFAVFDGKLAETGSFNWTSSADGYNFENAILISSPEVVSSYEAEFERIWRQANP